MESYFEAEFDMKKVMKAVWEFCSYVFVPQWGNKTVLETYGTSEQVRAHD